MKNLLNLGKALNKAEQKAVFGGSTITHYDESCDVPEGHLRGSGCPCTADNQCQIVGEPVWNSETQSWDSPSHGECKRGVCS